MEVRDQDIAIIALTGRFPGAGTVEELWRHLEEGVETTTFFSAEELIEAGVDPEHVRQPNYVRASPRLDGIADFDAAFFGLSPREAEILDPQHRLFMECAWEALESAGYAPASYGGAVGVFAGVFMSTYLQHNLLPHADLIREVGTLSLRHANDKDYIATRVSYKFDLKGPSMTVSTACSSSLLAVHLACQSLLNGECDLALAGGATVSVPQDRGYFYQEGGLLSPDGRCRTLDARAAGTIFGSGVGVVAMRRLGDALEDGDRVVAVIRGSAVNNDGAARVSYTAPGVDGEARVVAEALEMADAAPETISYVELHGTGTPLGDAVEMAALKEVFAAGDVAAGSCLVGSVKTNVGHLGTAAGVTGLIKTALMLEHGKIPASLHFERPNPKLGLEQSPFRVATTPEPWPPGDTPRRAGLSSFGFGGTNVHMVLEEAPPAEPSGASRRTQVLLLSARTPSALEEAARRLRQVLAESPVPCLADVAFTLQVGRKAFDHRRVVICRDAAEAAAALADPAGRRVFSRSGEREPRRLAFLFPGLGEHYPGMGEDLYRTEPTFRREMDHSARLLEPHLRCDLRQVLFAGDESHEGTGDGGRGPDLRRMLGRAPAVKEPGALAETAVAHCALFAVEHALASLLEEWGLVPEALAGYSLGEYVAACRAGVFPLEDALALVAERARRIEELPGGAMLAVGLGRSEAESYLGRDLWLAADNAPSFSVVAGLEDAVAELEGRLREDAVSYRRLAGRHAFHTPLMEPAAGALEEALRGVRLAPPKIPYLSNVTGRWISAEQATDPAYWARHLCQRVRFADGLAELWREPGRVLLEVGPGQSLSAFVRQDCPPGGVVMASMRTDAELDADDDFLLRTLGRLWLEGVEVDWQGFHRHERRRRLRLPTYPFERRRFWIDPPRGGLRPELVPGPARRPHLADWFYLPGWRPAKLTVPPGPAQKRDGGWLVFVDPEGLGEDLGRRLVEAGEQVATAAFGATFTQLGESRFLLDGDRPEHYQDLFAALGRLPRAIVHLGAVDRGATQAPPADCYFSRLLALARALTRTRVEEHLDLWVVSSSMQGVTDLEEPSPEKAMILGVCRTLPHEIPELDVRSIDVVLPPPGTRQWRRLSEQLFEEVRAAAPEGEVAYRGAGRWRRDFEPVHLPASETSPALRRAGVYFVTGGLGHVGLLLAEHLARRVGARLGLLGRSPFPPRESWGEVLAAEPDSATAHKIRRLRAIEESGAEVLVLRADVSEAEDVRRALGALSERFGALHGVIHAAGATGTRAYQAIRDLGPGDLGIHFRPKVRALAVLEEELAGYELDFCLLLSSLASQISGLGMAAYSAANIFMDTFARRHNQSSAERCPEGAAAWLSVNSDTWQLGKYGSLVPGGDDTAVGMTAAQGVEALERVLGLVGESQVAISAEPLAPRIERWLQPGKLRRLEVPAAAPRHERPHLQTAYVAPEGDEERRLAEVWKSLLGIEELGAHDNFFELGGHSLMATRVVNRIADEIGVRLPVRALFEAPTVRELAARIAHGEDSGALETALVPAVRDRPPPLSFAQQRLWLHEQMHPGTAVHNVPIALALRGRLDLPALADAFYRILARHETLRTTFIVTDEGEPAQRIHPATGPALPLVDLRALAAAGVGARKIATRLLWQQARRPFNLARDSMLRILVLRVADEEHVLFVNQHHIVSDNWSTGILVREIAHFYGRALAGRGEPGDGEGPPSSLAPLPVQYADYVAWQRRWLTSETEERQLAYWRRQLAQAPRLLRIPGDRPRPRQPSYRGERRSLALSARLTAQLLELARTEEATLFMVVLTAFKTVLLRWSGEEDLVVGTPVANRDRVELEGLIGFFVQLLALRTRLGGEPNLTEALKRVKETTLEALAHQELPFERLLDALNVERQSRHAPVFQVLFGMQNAPFETLRLPGLELEPIEVRSGATMYDLVLIVGESGDRLMGSFLFNTDIFDPPTAELFLEHLTAVLETMVTDPETRLLDVPLTGADRIPGDEADPLDANRYTKSEFAFL